MQDQHVAAAVAQHLDHRLARQLAALIIVRPHVSRDVHFLDFAFEIAGEHRHAGFVGFLDGRRNGDPVGGIQDNGRHALGEVVFDVFGLLLDIPFGVADDDLEAVSSRFVGQRVGDHFEERVLERQGRKADRALASRYVPGCRLRVRLDFRRRRTAAGQGRQDDAHSQTKAHAHDGSS